MYTSTFHCSRLLEIHWENFTTFLNSSISLNILFSVSFIILIIFKALYILDNNINNNINNNIMKITILRVETTYVQLWSTVLVSKRKMRKAFVYIFLAIKFVFHILLFPTNPKSVWKEQ